MYDLLVLSFNQNCAKEIRKKNICVRPQNEFGEQTKKYYNEIWPFINNAHGILYKIYTSYVFTNCRLIAYDISACKIIDQIEIGYGVGRMNEIDENKIIVSTWDGILVYELV